MGRLHLSTSRVLGAESSSREWASRAIPAPRLTTSRKTRMDQSHLVFRYGVRTGRPQQVFRLRQKGNSKEHLTLVLAKTAPWRSLPEDLPLRRFRPGEF